MSVCNALLSVIEHVKKLRTQNIQLNSWVSGKCNVNSRIVCFRFAIPADALRGFKALLLASVWEEGEPILEKSMRHSGHFGFSLRYMEYWASGADRGLLWDDSGITVFEIVLGSRLGSADLVAPKSMHVKEITFFRIPLENSWLHGPHKGSSELSEPESLCAVCDRFGVTFHTWTTFVRFRKSDVHFPWNFDTVMHLSRFTLRHFWERSMMALGHFGINFGSL